MPEVTADVTTDLVSDLTAGVIAHLAGRHLTLAVAESLTGGLLTAEFIRIPGASQVVNGGLVAYSTELKHSMLGVDAALLAAHGPVHPEVAMEMASGVRTSLAVNDRRADVGIATTGVAGPESQDGQLPGTVFLGLSMGMRSFAIALQLDGDRDSIRQQTVDHAVKAVNQLIVEHLAE